MGRARLPTSAQSSAKTGLNGRLRAQGALGQGLAPRGADVKILIVDDDPLVCTLAGAVLRAGGHVVEARGDALGTAAHLARFAPDVVLLDVSMPALTGDALATLLASRNRTGALILLFSSLPAVELEALVERCGASGFVEKHKPETLVARVEALAARPRP